jgi:hypothetical protein
MARIIEIEALLWYYGDYGVHERRLCSLMANAGLEKKPGGVAEPGYKMLYERYQMRQMKRQQSAKPNRIGLMTMRSNAMILALMLLACRIPLAWGATTVMVEDFEKVSSQPTVWVVNIPNENASVRLSGEQPHDGQQCLCISGSRGTTRSLPMGCK